MSYYTTGTSTCKRYRVEEDDAFARIRTCTIVVERGAYGQTSWFLLSSLSSKFFKKMGG
jgi:hypothetical protein